jgi:hypothetical protein
LASDGVAILVPMLGRPHRVAPLTASIRSNTPDPYTLLFLVTPGDRDVIREIRREHGCYLPVARRPRGDYARKINFGIDATTEPFVFTAADDLKFHPDWLGHAVKLMSATVGVVGTNDLSNRRVIRGQHSTHSLVARWYCELGTIDEPGKLLHEGYPHEFVDDELVGTAKKRKAWAFARDAVVEHLHPMANKAPMDDMYAQQGLRMRAGRRIYERRMPLWT